MSSTFGSFGQQRTKATSRLASLGGIPNMLSSSGSWQGKPSNRGSGKAHSNVASRFCIVLIAGLVFAACTLYLAEYTMRGMKLYFMCQSSYGYCLRGGCGHIHDPLRKPCEEVYYTSVYRLTSMQRTLWEYKN